MTRLPFASFWLFCLLLLGGCQNSPTQFAIIGDSPYGTANLLNQPKLPNFETSVMHAIRAYLSFWSFIPSHFISLRLLLYPL